VSWKVRVLRSARICDGTNVGCPGDARSPSSTVCRAASGCAIGAEKLRRDQRRVPADTYQPSGTVCRVSAGVLRSQETCSGASTTCPGDTRSASVPCVVECRCFVTRKKYVVTQLAVATPQSHSVPMCRVRVRGHRKVGGNILLAGHNTCTSTTTRYPRHYEYPRACGEAPLQVSCGSHTPADTRHTVPEGW